ncbi:alkene reductase [Micrococcus luteus]
MDTVFDPTQFGDIPLGSRLVMSGMGRRRADAEGTPTETMTTYYSQRAAAGLIIAESTHPSWEGKNQPGSPHMITDADEQAWKEIVDAVHDNDGTIVLQLMHAGGNAHPSVNGDRTPLAPSDVIPTETIRVGAEMLPHARPQPLTEAGLREVIDDFAQAARRAVAAGFDGVEIHAGNGFLLHQFLSPHTNTRTDKYGGKPESRCRFPVAVIEGVVAAVGAARVGLRISPGASITALHEPDLLTQYGQLLSRPEIRALAYLHTTSTSAPEIIEQMRSLWPGRWIHNMGTDPTTPASEVLSRATATLARGADAVSLGRLFISNPDLPRRLATNAALAAPDFTTFYTGGARGYTDYAPLETETTS